MPTDIVYSVVIPVYNEAENLPALYRSLQDKLLGRGDSCEVVFVDDGSTDGSFEIIKGIAAKDGAIKVIRLRRNYGQTAALQAGVSKAAGGIIIPLDADLQNDPDDIPALIHKLEQGFDVVSGWRKARQDGFLRVALSRIANAIISRASGLLLHDHGCSLKAYRRETFRELRLYGEVHRVLALLMYWQGASVAEIAVAHHPRRSGSSKYNLTRTFKLILDLVTYSFMSSYVTKPNYVFGTFGLGSGLLSIVAFAIVAYRVLILRQFEATPLVFIWVLFTLSSLLFFLMGLLAEMLARIYFDADGKKPYQIRETVNFD